MKFDKVQFVYIDMSYLKKLNEIESEIFYDAENENYKENQNIDYYIKRIILFIKHYSPLPAESPP